MKKNHSLALETNLSMTQMMTDDDDNDDEKSAASSWRDAKRL